MKTSVVVLLTATVKPKDNQPQLKVIDPDERFEEYRQSLSYVIRYLEKGLIDGVVFVENSTYRIDELRNEFSRDGVEIIAYHGLNYPDGYHRGYGEYLLMNTAMAQSELINNLDAQGIVLKITGRYKVLNLPAVVSHIGKSFDFVCERRTDWAEMSVMCWTRGGFAGCMNGLEALFSGGLPPEVYLDGHLNAVAQRGMRVGVFVWPPLLSGKRGSDGGAHSSKWTAARIVVTGLGRVVRRVFSNA